LLQAPVGIEIGKRRRLAAMVASARASWHRQRAATPIESQVAALG
jgi:hypothetical protein